MKNKTATGRKVISPLERKDSMNGCQTRSFVFEERAAIMEYMAGMTREQAEEKAREDMARQRMAK